MTEAAFQRDVIDLAHLCGWKAAHFAAARTAKGWRTPARADGKGFVDLVLVGHGQVLFVEAKSDDGELSPEQEQWRDWLLAAGQDWRLWRPSDWPEIQRTLDVGKRLTRRA